MKATKKIVGAAVALVAAVALSAGSTFAWFATSNTATATNMVVQAVVPTNLLIAKEYQEALGDQFSNTVDFAAAAKKLNPSVVSNTQPDYGEPSTSGVDATGGKIYVLNATAWDTQPDYDNAGNASTYELVGEATASGASLTWTPTYANHGQYVAVYDMTLGNGASEGGKSLDISASVEASGETDTIEFVRAGLLAEVSAGTYKLFSTANTGTHTWSYSNIIQDLAAQGVATVSLLVWFDGQDENCKVSGAQDIDDITFSITFTASEHGGA